jgi:hypothetical protein
MYHKTKLSSKRWRDSYGTVVKTKQATKWPWAEILMGVLVIAIMCLWLFKVVPAHDQLMKKAFAKDKGELPVGYSKN